MNAIQRALHRVDDVQRRHRPLAFAFAVNKKFGDDTAGNLAALITYYGFLSLFPLLLVLVTVLAIVGAGHPTIIKNVQNSAFSEFPVIGKTIAENIQTLKNDSAFGLVVGLLGLVWGAQGIVSTGQQAMADVWNVPRIERPGFAARLGRSATMLGAAAVFLIISTAASGIVEFNPKSVATGLEVLGVAVALLLNVGLYVIAFRVLTPKSVHWRQLLPGAFVAGTAWTLLQNLGAALIHHQLQGANELYGTFGLVLGLLAWIFLGARITMYAAEINVVHARKLWPRSLVQPPLTEADTKVYAALTEQTRQKPQQHVTVTFSQPTTSDPAAEIESETDATAVHAVLKDAAGAGTAPEELSDAPAVSGNGPDVIDSEDPGVPAPTPDTSG